MSDDTTVPIIDQGNYVREGIWALEALESDVACMFSANPLVAEISIHENAPIRALVVESYGTTRIFWNGERWMEEA